MNAPLPTPVAEFTNPFQMEYTYVAGTGRSTFLRGLAHRRLLARRCDSCDRVYLPSPEFCSRCLTELSEPFPLDGTGTVSTFCVVNFPFPGQVIDPPYLVAYIQVDGADTRLMHLIRETDLSAVHIGMRVEPVWCDDDELSTSMNSIRYYRPIDANRTGEADA
ncbi:Zn-ribbon domain-containing OB-fold protein [Nocardia donostiensis]|uniref:DNA-binding protein n=1 Tax=Nocardia donostiensis TaxID=1538463 RepID=A0A1W0B2Q2_9NOCA|nr:Zn-ribbon domain-containing OB-fold protein [Nocardia donostiensis]ONM48611.1 DNA-binding protein [Nocardia donostiensis]OQS16800.1 DNA-binding protein [Nocardia donostiensis]OQS23265.1 DNA-binding protein [Nocardia donostiensis]